MPPKTTIVYDPLADNSESHSGAYPGAVLLSDQIEYYIRELPTPLITNPDGGWISDAELGKCLDAASYKLRLGNEANLGGRRVAISCGQPLVLAPHQVAVVKTHEEINIPRFLIARWNLRVTWVYEGLLWVGGPQVDPGWHGALYCPIYNLAEREVVIPYMERVFTMDFTRTTPFQKKKASYGYKSKPHEIARQKNLQGHDIQSATERSLLSPQPAGNAGYAGNRFQLVDVSCARCCYCCNRGSRCAQRRRGKRIGRRD